MSNPMDHVNKLIADIRAERDRIKADRAELRAALERLTERVELVNRGVAESVELIGLAQEARSALSTVKP